MMSAFVEKAMSIAIGISNAAYERGRKEGSLERITAARNELRAHLEAREAVTEKLAEALTRISKIPNQPFGHDYEEIDDARMIALMVLQAYDEASKT